MSQPNVLFITVDQFRGDCLSSAGHPLVQTPHLDHLASQAVRFSNHHAQAAPCAPGRASLYTGMYQMNHRVVANGTPLDHRFDNVARLARRTGYRPTLFGYTDQAVDPRRVTDRTDARLWSYSGILPGFDVALDLPDEHGPWVQWLEELGHDVSAGPAALLAGEPDRPAEHGVSAFLTDRFEEWVVAQRAPWFAHLSYLRPHPPYAAAGHWSQRYQPADCPAAIAPEADRHRLHDMMLANPRVAAPTDPAALARLRAQYYGMVSEVDHQMGRLWQLLERVGAWAHTVVVVTSDHGELLGDHGLVGKVGWWDEAFHIPCIVRDPRLTDGHGTVVDAFTESVDVLPTIAEAIGAPVPHQCDGRALRDFVRGGTPQHWRTTSSWEFDWRDELIRSDPDRHRTDSSQPDPRLERANLAVLRSSQHSYVQFGDGTWRCFDFGTDPAGGAQVDDPAVVLPLVQEMVLWRSRHLDRTLTGMLTEHGGIGRWPPGVPFEH